ncbi:MAG: FAD-binding protein [Candidatus Pacebacteria bacterium]|nr:FAD-binding protein [Candidatus Paceibacterota bacterium]
MTSDTSFSGSHLLAQLSSVFPDLEFQPNYPMKKLTYFKVGGPAEVLVKIHSRQNLIELVRYCQKNQIKFTVLGGASNVIVSDQGISGLVIIPDFDRVELIQQDQLSQSTQASQDGQVSQANRASQVGQAGQTIQATQASQATQATQATQANQAAQSTGLLRVEAGARTALAVAKSVELGLTGLEYFLGIPGRIGGAVYNNAHYLSDLISDYIKQVEIIDHNGRVRWLSKKECDFAYDHSRFHQTKEVILRVDFLLPKVEQDSGGAKQSGGAKGAEGSGQPKEILHNEVDKQAGLKPSVKSNRQPTQQLSQKSNKKAVGKSREKIKQATEYRAKTQPLGLPSSGCIFKNTPNTPELRKKFPQFADKEFVPTGFLIDQAGLKGESVGDIEVSHKHAAFFVNHGQGTANDIKQLLEKVQRTIKQKFNVELEPEVFWLE